MDTNERTDLEAGEFDPDQGLVDLLVAFDTQLAGDGESLADESHRPSGSLSHEVIESLEEAKRCVRRLERVWPRGKPPDAEAPSAIGRFQILRRLGQGGFGIVYLADDPKLERAVALKVQRPEAILSATLRHRFVREAKAAARLRHPNIAAVHEAGEEGVLCWIAAEYCEGGSLAAWLHLNSPAVSPRAAAAFMAALAEAIHYAHDCGVLHRDLKPSNVLLQRCDAASSGTRQAGDLSAFNPKLIDFGLAKLRQTQQQETRTGALLGTPSYMAPEQAQGENDLVSAATDVYGLGAILYELLTGGPPFSGTSDADTLRKIVSDEPLSPRRLRAEIPRDLEAIALRCLEKEPGKRYATAGALSADLRCYLAGQPTLARPLSGTQRLAKWARRRPAVAGLVAVSILAALTVVLLAGAYVVQLRESKNVADELRGAAETSASAARRQESLANRYLYAARMREAYEVLKRGDARGVDALLKPYEPGSRLAELRGFEWYHLKHRIHAERFSLNAHRGEVYTVAFSPDGRVLASGGQDGTIRFWDPERGTQVAVLEAHPDCVNAVAYSTDGRTLLSVSCDRSIKFWDAATHQMLAKHEEHPGVVLSLSVSADGKRAVTGCDGGLVVLWDIASRSMIKSVHCPGSNGDFAVWKDNETVLLPTNVDGYVQTWNVDNDAIRAVDCNKKGRSRSLTISPDGRDVVVSGNHGGICSIAPLSEHVVRTEGAGYEPYSLAFQPDGKRLIAGYDDATVHVYSWPEPSAHHVLAGHRGRVQAIAVAPAGDQFATASFDGTVKLWGSDFEPLAKVQSVFVRPRSSVPSHLLGTSADLEFIALPTEAKRVAVFEVGSGQETAALELPHSPWALSLSSSESSIVYGYSPDSQSIWRWNWRTGLLKTIASTPPGQMDDALLLLNARQLVVTPRGGEFPYVFDTVSQEVWWDACRPATRYRSSVIASPDEGICVIRTVGQVAENTWDYHNELIDLNRKQVIANRSTGVQTIANGGRTLALDPGELGVTLWDAVGKKEISRVHHRNAVLAAALSPDGKTLAEVDVHGWLQLWNVATGHLMAQLEASTESAIDLRFSRDGRKLALFAGNELPMDAQDNRIHCKMFVWSASDDP